MKLPAHIVAVRENQQHATDEILQAFYSSSVVMLDAPTGSGKTLIGEMVRQSLLDAKGQPGVRGLYLCSTLDLQTQFSRDFPDAAILRGRSNYKTMTEFPADLTAADCVKRKTVRDNKVKMVCQWCDPVHACPYERAKAEAIRAVLACSNLTYFLYESNFVGNLALNRGLIVIDEADLIEDALLNFVTVHVSPHQQEEYGLVPPEKKTVESAWVDWAADAQGTVESLLARADGRNLRDIRKRKALERLLGDIKRLNNEDTGLASGNWVYTGYDRGAIEFKPVRVHELAQDFLWRHGPRFLLMSATTISFQAMAESLGIG